MAPGWLGFLHSTHDDRGRRVPAFREPSSQRIEAAIPRRDRLILVGACLALIAFACLWRYILPARMDGRPPASAVAVGLGLAVGSGVFFWWPPRLNRAAARAALKTGRCGSCGYDLAGLRAAEDGAAVCPECGAAWRL